MFVMDFDKTLIEEIRKREFLYNRKLQSYRNIDLRERGWHQIAAATQSDADACKIRWRTLRDRFCKEAGKKPTSAGWKTSRRWPLFQNLLFLKEHVTRRAGGNYPLLEDTTTSPPPSEAELLDALQDTKSMEISEFTIMKPDLNIMKPDLNIMKPDLNITKAPEINIPKEKVRKPKRYTGNIDRRQISCLVSAMDSFVANSSKAREDEVNEPFLKMVSQKLNEFPPNMREDKKMDILNWLHTELTEYKESTKSELS